MKTQHTKGPWIVKGFTYIDYVNANGRLQEIARVTEPASNSVKAQCEAFEVAKANARLIATAPELLEALEKLLNDHKAMTKEVEFLRRQKIPAIKENILHTHCDQVIKKARGES